MLELKVHDGDNEVVLQFEHSLLALSKWESKYKKAFLGTAMKSSDEMIDYFQAMLMSPDVDSSLVYRLSPEQLDQLATYVSEELTASSVPSDPNMRGVNEVVTSELVYYWMVALRIPFQPTETWHLSRLMMLIKITNHKAQPAKKRNPAQALKDWAVLNQRNKERFGTTG